MIFSLTGVDRAALAAQLDPLGIDRCGAARVRSDQRTGTPASNRLPRKAPRNLLGGSMRRVVDYSNMSFPALEYQFPRRYGVKFSENRFLTFRDHAPLARSDRVQAMPSVRTLIIAQQKPITPSGQTGRA